MGNFFQGVPNKEINRPLLRFLKTKNINQITEVFKYLNDQYVSACTINLEEFQDIYSSFLQNYCDPVFQSLQNDGSLEGRVDIYESMALIVIFCMEEYTFKLRYLFDLFDFDQSQQIEKKELIITCQTTIRCICKIIGIPTPEIKTIEEYAKKAYVSADQDQNQSISYKEFEFWVCQEQELQAFLLQYAGIQTFENTVKRFKERLALFDKLFEEASEGKKSLPLSDLSMNLLQHVNNEEVPLLLQALTESSISYGKIMDNNEDVIHLKSYNQIMMAWCSFDASEVNNSDTICVIELQFLLYAYEEQKFNQEYINQQLEIMDKDKSGDISRLEWLTYLNLIHDSGLTVFQGQMKKQFRKIFQENNSTISVEQFKDLIISNYSMYVKDESNFNQAIDQSIGDLNQNEFNAWKEANVHIQSIIKQFPELERFQW